jgi:hypothetical protein
MYCGIHVGAPGLLLKLGVIGYVDHMRSELSFEVGDFVYLKVIPGRGLRHFKVRGKLTPRFIGPLKIMEKRGEVSYQLELWCGHQHQRYIHTYT